VLLGVDQVDRRSGVRKRVALRAQIGVDRRLQGGCLLFAAPAMRRALGREQFFRYIVHNHQRGNPDLVITDGLQRQRRRPGDAPADARHPFRVGRMLAIGLGNHKHRHRAVLLRVQHFHPGSRVARIAFAIKDGACIILLRFVVEDQRDLPSCIQPFVVVIAEFRRGNAVAREHHRRRQVHFMAKAPNNRGRFRLDLHPAAGQLQKAHLAVGTIFDQRDGLHEAWLPMGVGGCRSQAGLGKLVRNPPDRGFIAGLQAHAPLQRVGRDVGEVAPKIRL
jgi:hypothetical protein